MSDGFARAVPTAKVVALLTLGLLTVLVYAVYIAVYGPAPLTGDEVYYYRHVESFRGVLRSFLSGDWAAIPGALHGIIENGWFIPTISLLLAPPSVFGADYQSVRLLYFAINVALHLVALDIIRRKIGFWTMCLFHTLTLLFPPYLVFMLSLFGEGLASQLLLLIALWLFVILGREQAVSLRETIGLGLLLALAVLTRHNLLLICPVVAVALLLDTYRKQPGALPGRLRPGLLRAVVLTAIVTALFLPWSVALSQKFDGPYFNTTTRQIAYIWDNAPRSFTEARLGPDVPRGRNYHRWAAYYQDLARSTGEPYHDLVERDRQLLREAIAANAVERERLAGERQARRAGILQPSEFLRFRLTSHRPDRFPMSEPAERVFAVIEPLNRWLWQPLLALALLAPALLVTVDRRNRPGWLSTGALLVTATTTLYLFGAHTRHYAILYPLMLFVIASAVGLLVNAVVRSRPHVEAPVQEH